MVRSITVDNSVELVMYEVMAAECYEMVGFGFDEISNGDGTCGLGCGGRGEPLDKSD